MKIIYDSLMELRDTDSNTEQTKILQENMRTLEKLKREFTIPEIIKNSEIFSPHTIE